MEDKVSQANAAQTPPPISFKAETHQLLDILIHSLYTEREIFLRELISNASDALTRVDFEILTNRNLLDAEAELAISITANPDEHTLTIRDTGIGMTAEEMVQNLGTIAHSGAREFIQAARESGRNQGGGKSLSDLIGQFGVGFYSAFMVAEWIRVTSRSFQPEASAATWYCTGADTFTVEPAEKADRGTTITVKLKEDAAEFAREYRLREIIRRHSDFIPFPIYLGEDKEQVNRRTAIWRQSPREVNQADYDEFYKQLTLEHDAPMLHAHMVVDAPVQLYALLYVPATGSRSPLSSRREQGLKLYARKVLIQEYNRDLLPEYLDFVQGVVDSEDLPLNVSRESVQANKVMAQLNKLITGKVLDSLKKLSEDAQKYNQFWDAHGRYLKQGVGFDQGDPSELFSLLRFHTNLHPDSWTSLDDYISRMQPGQDKIYYLTGEDEHSLLFSPHLDIVRPHGYEVLLMAEPVDAFMLVRLSSYQEHSLASIADPHVQLPVVEKTEAEVNEELPESDFAALLEQFRTQLGERVSGVRLTDRLSEAPARLVDPDNSPNPQMQRVLRMLNQKMETPPKVLELNPRHPILLNLKAQPESSELSRLVMEQVYEDALLIEGLHPDPAGMIQRIQKLMEAALEKPAKPATRRKKS